MLSSRRREIRKKKKKWLLASTIDMLAARATPSQKEAETFQTPPQNTMYDGEMTLHASS